MTAAVEVACRRLASAMGAGCSWRADMQFHARGPWTDQETSPCDALVVARQTETLERADRSAGIGEHRRWSESSAWLAVPTGSMDTDALAALAFAQLTPPEEAMLRFYALEDESALWALRRFAMAELGDSMAVDEGLVRLLWPKASGSCAARAKVLRLRKHSYVQRVGRAEALYHCWLESAVREYLRAFGDSPER